MRTSCLSSIRPYPVLAVAEWQRHTRHALLAVAAVGLLFLGQATAQEPAADSAQTSAPVGPGKNGKVCKQEDVTGSRMKKRVCHTPEQWEARERASRDLVRELDRKPAGGHSGD
ncbi:hypothetical protein [Luteimonas sp. A482]